jgi:hypothetical protein
MNWDAIGAILKSLAAFEDEIAHNDPLEAVSWAGFILFTMIRERILFPESVQIIGLVDDARLSEEITGAFYSYLTGAGGNVR